MKKGLVSIITPSYNCGEYCDRFFNAILNQTYRKIELIYIVDGSTDNTMEKIAEYEDRFKMAGIIFKWKYKKNGGVCTAINEGLKMFDGEYVVFHDADDYYNPNAIEKMMKVLEKNPSYAIVGSNLQMLSENNKKLKKFYNTNEVLPDNVLPLIASFNKFAYTGLMYRSSAIIECIPKLQIDVSPYGQNYQLIIPVCSKYKYWYINEPLLNYLVRSNSLSHSKDSLEKKISKNHELKKLLKSELNKVGKLGEYEDKIDIAELKEDFIYYVVFNDPRAKEQYKVLKHMHMLTPKYRLFYMLYRLKMIRPAIIIYEKLTGMKI